MLGLYGFFTPVSAAVGINRSLVMNPKITNTRGYLGKDFNLKDATQDELLTFGELVNGFNATHADATRVCMATTQSKHIVPTKVSHPGLVGTGADKALVHVLGQDFCFKASEDGVISSIDSKNKLIFITYNNGVKTAIDMEAKPVFNQGSGFYTTNELKLLPQYKVGTKFKKSDVIALNDSFFKQTADEDSHLFCAGRLSKVAIMCMDNTFEDSSVITAKLADEMSVDIISGREVVLKQNSKLISIAHVGEVVDVNTPLVIFEEVGDNEKEALDALDKLSTDDKDTVSKLARNMAKAKYAGEIVSVEVFYNTDLENLHPSLRDYVNDYITRYTKKANSLKGIKEDDLITLPNTNKIESDKIMGTEMQGVMINFYIKHTEPMNVGNKVTFFSSCKTIIAEVIEEGKEPYSDYHKDQSVDAILTPMSLVSRMLQDVPLLGFSNKVLLELKMQILEEMGLKK